MGWDFCFRRCPSKTAPSRILSSRIKADLVLYSCRHPLFKQKLINRDLGLISCSRHHSVLLSSVHTCRTTYQAGGFAIGQGTAPAVAAYIRLPLALSRRLIGLISNSIHVINLGFQFEILFMRPWRSHSPLEPRPLKCSRIYQATPFSTVPSVEPPCILAATAAAASAASRCIRSYRFMRRSNSASESGAQLQGLPPRLMIPLWGLAASAAPR